MTSSYDATPDPLEDTAEAPYTAEALSQYAAGDPLTDPLPGQGSTGDPSRTRVSHLGAPPGPPPGYASMPAPAPAAAPQAPAVPPAPVAPPIPQAPPAAQAPPASPASGWPQAPTPPPLDAQAGPSVVPGGPAPQVKRFMTATDFLDRRADSVDHGPATWGLRGFVRRASGGLIKPRMGRAELEHMHDRAQIQRDFDGPRTIAFINPKGGAAKTTGVLMAGYTFGTVRGGGVVAWDNNETRGTLGIRGARSNHRNTTRELLSDISRFSDIYQSRIGDLGAFVRSQGDAHFDVLASDERPDVTGQIHADDFSAIHQLLQRYYKLLILDTGNNLRAENWLAAVDAADLLVVTSTVREDTGYSGLWMLDALQDAGHQNLKHRTVTVLSDPSPKVDEKLAADLVEVYEQRTRAVFRVPYDPALVSGSVVGYHQLSRGTRMSWLKACAAMAGAL